MKQIILSALLAISFSACSESHFKEAETIVNIDIACKVDANSTDISEYITMFSSDALVKAEDANSSIETVVSTYHDANGTKKVCLVSGKAYLVRQ